ncbi:uncharacterized protein LOC113369897 [Ctenocephalides felis]|uniref:uncharacterized protein LOC113369897 n=1 Tax=Ctenocephalides felis TaxID=7515 RepID=UPI000E6E307E|nr:uncharacterized protein LOC113369897 [Ctenocephalides felis]
MPPKSVSASAEVARLISKREMYFSIIQKTYDLSRDVEDASSKQQFCTNLVMLDNIRDQFIKLTDDINKLNALENPSFVPDYAALLSVEQLYAEIKYIEKTISAVNNTFSFTKSEDSPSKFISKSRLPTIEIPEFAGDLKKMAAILRNI